MNILDYVIIIFIVLESLNVMVLYLSPGSKMGNGVGVFDDWNNLKQDELVHLFTKYLVNWVAGTKFIFLMLLVVILVTGSDLTKLLGVIAMICSISLYFFKLHPIVKKLDQEGKLTPKGYSKVLGNMIGGFIAMFVIALVWYLVN